MPTRRREQGLSGNRKPDERKTLAGRKLHRGQTVRVDLRIWIENLFVYGEFLHSVLPRLRTTSIGHF